MPPSADARHAPETPHGARHSAERPDALPETTGSIWSEVGQLRVHTRATPPGPVQWTYPVVLVHGLGISSRYMMPAARCLAPYGPVYAPDLPGFGRSARPPKAWAVPDLAAFLAAWAETLSIDRAVWLGNSFGCQILVELALRHEKRVAGLLLQGMTPDAVHRSALRHVACLALDAFLEPPSLVFLAAGDYLRAGISRCWRTFRHLMADPIEDKLPHVRVPAIVVRGARDPIVSAQWAERAASLMPQGSLVIVQGAAHAVNYSHPEALVPLVRSLAERPG